MKKTLLFLLTVVALFTISCKDSKKTTADDPVIPDTVFTEISYLCGEYVGLLDGAGSPEYYQFLFSQKTVTMNADGTFNGSGKVYLITLFAPSKDQDNFPENGVYSGDDTLNPNTFYCTDSETANGFSAIYTITDGSIDYTNIVRFNTGLITILGTAANSDFLFALEDENNEEHFFHYAGAAPIDLVDY